MKKIPNKYTGLLTVFYTTAMMAFIMSAVLVAINAGIHADYLSRLIKSYLSAWPIAFVSLLTVRPLVQKLVLLSTDRGH